MKIEIRDNLVIVDGIEYVPKDKPVDNSEKLEGFKLSNTSLNRLKNVHPRLIEVIKKAIVNSPYDFIITSGARTTEEQKKLYAQGRTEKGSKVTNCDGVIHKSNHQLKADGYGYAIDFGIYDKSVKGSIDWNSTEKYIAVAKHIIEVAKNDGLIVESGCFWKSFKDNPHIELKGVIK